jgi:Zn-dependent peptidase ImmA (M78 family)
LEAILRAWQIGWTVVKQGSDAHGIVHKDQSGRYMIGVPDERGERARFTVAHELAHVLADLAGVARPATKPEYWALEQLCDEAAGRLLMPESYLRPVLVETEKQLPLSSAVLAAVARVRKDCLVSDRAAAHRLTDALGEDGQAATVARLRRPHESEGRSSRESDPVLAVVSWVKGNGAGLRPKSHLRSDSDIVRALSGASGTSGAARIAWDVPLAGAPVGRTGAKLSSWRYRGDLLVAVTSGVTSSAGDTPEPLPTL